MGRIPFDLLILNVQLVNVLTAKIYATDIAIIDGEFAYVGKALPIHKADTYFDAEGAFAVPGYIDGHMHIESSMMTPANFARAVVPMGTTTVAADPHEIANVLGEQGVQLLADRSFGLPLHIHIMAPSTIPSAPGFETSGACIGPDEVVRMLAYPGVLGLGEVMDFNGVIAGDPTMLAIIDAAKQQGVLLDGHVPTLRGYQLQAFIASGIDADHTYMDPSIVEEKLQNGMAVQIQERFFTSELMEYLNQAPVQDRIMLVTDDVPISRLAKHGHVDALLRHAVALGLDPGKAVRYVTINAANRLRLYHTGAIAPGYRADLVLLDNLSSFRALSVFSDGRLVAQKNSMVVPSQSQPFPPQAFNTMHLKPVSPADFKIEAEGNNTLVNVILQDGRTSRTTQSQVRLPIIKNVLQQENLMKMSIFERHTGLGTCSHGLIGNMEGFKGAIATSYAHDCHNLIVYSANDEDAALAANTVIATGGGVAAVLDGIVLGSIALPIAGLLCEEKMDSVAEKFAIIDKAAKENLHLNHEETLTFITLMPLAVSPEIKLTDKGLLDVIHKRFIPLLASCNDIQADCSQ
jgi:adenine deaminase